MNSQRACALSYLISHYLLTASPLGASRLACMTTLIDSSGDMLHGVYETQYVRHYKGGLGYLPVAAAIRNYKCGLG